MKKTISINLQGIIFHVEEDGYALLHSYLTSVKNYFIAFEGHEEIMADIESRMAELFLTRLSAGKQIISLEDVQHLIARMGSVQDFAAQNEAEEEAASAGAGAHYASDTHTDATTGPKKLYLDVNRKKLAGVAAGIANYLGIDPLWIRLAFVFVALVGSPFSAGGSFGLALITYIVLWIVLPPSQTLPETKTKKLYRDPDNKKLSGVSGGLGAYFGTDPLWFRLFFLVSFFFGIGIFLYIILWIIMPEAHTPSEKAEMRGNPVTLSSIEEAIKKNSAFQDERGRDNVLARIVLLPVQLLSQIFEALGPALKVILLFLLEVIRILAGIMLLLTGLTLMASAVVILTAGFGGIPNGEIGWSMQAPLEILANDLPWPLAVSACVAVFIPGLVLMIMGLGLLAKRNLMKQQVGWTLFGLWIGALLVFAITFGTYATNFRHHGIYTKETVFEVPEGQLQLSLKRSPDTRYRKLDLTLEPHRANTLLLISEFESQGETEDAATRHAQMIDLPVQQQDSQLVFASHAVFHPDAVFRRQRLQMRLLIPENKPFRVSPDLMRRINILPASDLIPKQGLSNNSLMFENGKLRCLTCSASDSARASRPNKSQTLVPQGSSSKTYSLGSFSKVSAAGGITVVITQGEHQSVKAYGSRSALRDLELEIENGNMLRIKNKRSLWRRSSAEQITVAVTVPALTEIRLAGAVTGKVSGFTADTFRATLVGASTADLDIRCTNLEADIVGASTLNVSGTATGLEADVVGASELNAYELLATRARIDAVGASRAKVHVTDRLEAEAVGASSIRYRGSPLKVEKDESGAGSVQEE